MVASTNGRIAEQVIGRPAPALAPYVQDYTGYHQAGFEPGFHAGLPSRHLTFIVSLDAPVDCVAVPDPAQPGDRFDALLGGLHASPALIRHDGNQRGVQLQLTPLGARALFGCPASELAGSVLHLGDVLGGRVEQLRERLHLAATWPERFEVLDEVLASCLRPHAEPRAEVTQAWSMLTTTDGTVPVGRIADEVGWSRRHLAGQFRDEYGLTPKVMARVMRFEAAKRLLTLPTAPSLASVAAYCGYADQAHLGREWKELAGDSPAAWRAAEDLLPPPTSIEPRS